MNKYNSFYNYSSKNSPKNSSIVFIDNKYSCFIPPIINVNENYIEGEGKFNKILLGILKELSDNKETKYKFIFISSCIVMMKKEN